MSNEELALAIRQGDQGRTLELWEQVNGLVKRKAMQIMTALQLSGNPRGVEFDDLYHRPAIWLWWRRWRPTARSAALFPDGSCSI